MRFHHKARYISIKMKKFSCNQIFIVWFVMQFLFLASRGVHHIGELIIGGIFFVSLIGIIFGRNKVRIMSLFGLSVYSALSFIGAVMIVAMTYNLPGQNPIYGVLYIVCLIVAIINLFLVFKAIKDFAKNDR